MRAPLRLALLGLSLPAILQAGLFDAARRDLLGARNAGLGGADVAADPSAEALAHNPASLPTEGDWQLAALIGSSQGQSEGAAGLAWVLDPATRLGFLFDSHADSRYADLDEQTYAGLASLDLAPRLRLGLRAKALRLRSLGSESSIWAGSLDLGLQSDAWRVTGLPGTWSLGLAGDNVVNSSQDDDWRQSVPSALRLGLGWRPLPSLWLGGEGDWVTAPQLAAGSTQDWHGGAEWQALGAWALRGGWRTESGGQWTAGAGGPIASTGARLDLAFLSANSAGPGAERLTLTWSFEKPLAKQLNAEPEQVLLDPESGIVQSARFKVSLDARLQATQWRLELKDANGKVVRTLGPFDATEGAAEWDGRGEDDSAVPEGGQLGYSLIAATPAGELRRDWAPPLALAAERHEQKVAAAREDKALSAPILKPVFSSSDSAQLDHVEMELPALRGSAAAKGWRVEIQDSKQRVIRTLAGVGEVPTDLVWDGRDDQGYQVRDALGVNVRVEVEDAAGAKHAQAQALFSQKTFELARQEARQRPELRLASLGLPLLVGSKPLALSAAFLQPLIAHAQQAQQGFEASLRRQELDERRRQFQRQEKPATWDFDLFDDQSSQLRPERADLLQGLQDKASAGKGGTLWVAGLAKKGEAPAVAQQRALSLAKQFRRQGSLGAQIVLVEAAPPSDYKGVHVEEHPAPAPAGPEAFKSPALKRAAPEALRARYSALGLEQSDLPEDSPDQALPAEQLKALLIKWGLDSGPAPAITRWSPATGKLAIYKDGWIWVTDAPSHTLRSLWYEPDLAAAGQLRWNADGTVLWMRADGWRRWMSLALRVE